MATQHTTYELHYRFRDLPKKTTFFTLDDLMKERGNMIKANAERDPATYTAITVWKIEATQIELK